MKSIAIGTIFGEWTTISEVTPFKDKSGYTRYKCLARCTCGSEKLLQVSSLLSGSTTRCVTCGNTKHNNCRTRLYNIWNGMKKRCYTKSSTGYENYGAKGIKVCKEWLTYEPFKIWALQAGYMDNLTIDRINGSLNYSPENCRWVTIQDNLMNKDTVKLIGAFGEQKLCSEWANDSRCVVAYSTLYRRLNSGWNPEKAITTEAPKGGYKAYWKYEHYQKTGNCTSCGEPIHEIQ